MIHKKTLKSRPAVKITFEIEADVEADDLQLVADFTDWAPVPFTHLKSGKWKLAHEVTPGQDYQFRYRVVRGNDVLYMNDRHADGYVANQYGTENAVLAC